MLTAVPGSSTAAFAVSHALENTPSALSPACRIASLRSFAPANSLSLLAWIIFVKPVLLKYLVIALDLSEYIAPTRLLLWLSLYQSRSANSSLLIRLRTILSKLPLIARLILAGSATILCAILSYFACED